MWTDIGVQGALSGFKAIGGYITAKRQAKADKAWQEYNNKLTRMQDALNQNALTTNENILRERVARDKYNVEVSKYRTQAESEVASAAIGAEGNSVDLAMLEISQNAARAQHEIEVDADYQFMGYQQQRTSSRMQTEMQLDYKQIVKPSIASAVFGWGAETLMHKIKNDSTSRRL